MKKLDFDTGSRVANTIDKRIITVVNQMLKTSTLNRTVYGRVTSASDTFFSVKINNTIYDNVCALKNVGEIKVGDRVMCLVPNNQFNDLTIIGVVDGTIENLDNKIWEKVYPVGSIYISINNTNPNIIFGGKWKLLDEGYALWTTTTSGTGGNTISAGLPNIAGRINVTTSYNDYNSSSLGVLGAFAKLGTVDFKVSSYNGACAVAYESFNASDGECGTQKMTPDNADEVTYANNVYGKSETVQPPAIKVFAWERIA